MSIPPRPMRDALLENILRSMAADRKIFFLTADFGSPVLDRIRDQCASRFVNVGIAEQNLINVAAGLALEGFTVFAYAIAPFITLRCYEQIRVNLALQSEVRPLNVNLIGVGAGYSYPVSGPTHQSYEDLAAMRALPNIAIFSPADHVTAALLADRCISKPGPKYLRLDAQVLPVLYGSAAPCPSLGFHVHRGGEGVCLIATGYMVHSALEAAGRLAAAGIRAGVIDIFDISGFAAGELESILRAYKAVVTMEEGFRGRGGLDALMFEFLSRRNIHARMLNIGVEPRYRFELGTRQSLHEKIGIGVGSICDSVSSFLRNDAQSHLCFHIHE